MLEDKPGLLGGECFFEVGWEKQRGMEQASDGGAADFRAHPHAWAAGKAGLARERGDFEEECITHGDLAALETSECLHKCAEAGQRDAGGTGQPCEAENGAPCDGRGGCVGCDNLQGGVGCWLHHRGCGRWGGGGVDDGFDAPRASWKSGCQQHCEHRHPQCVAPAGGDAFPQDELHDEHGHGEKL